MKYQEELIGSLEESELMPLLQSHWEELANNKDIRPLDIDFDGYINLNQLGVLRLFTARTDAGKLVGYFSFVISHNLHYKTWLQANVDVYYIDPSFRGAGAGTEMVAKVEEWLKTLEVKSVVMMDKVHHSHEKFFNRLGYKLIEYNYEKIL